MAIVVVGGHTRNVGKTSVAAGLISALRDLEWTAVKITQFGHGICSQHAEPCECSLVDGEHAWALDEEVNRKGKTDSSRFLVAGASKCYWLRTQQGKLAEAMPALRDVMAGAKNVMLESNSVIQFLRPDLYISVLDPETKDFKSSAQRFLDRADAVVMHGSSGAAQWDGVSYKLIEAKPRFEIHPPEYVTTELVEFVRKALSAHPVEVH